MSAWFILENLLIKNTIKISNKEISIFEKQKQTNIKNKTNY